MHFQSPKLMRIKVLRFLIYTIMWLPFLNTLTAAFAEPMSFRNVSDGGNFASCCWTVAEGEITSDTPDQFRAFVIAERAEGSTVSSIRLIGLGNDIEAAMELGRAFRQQELNITIGRSRMYHDPWFEELQEGACSGACVLSFLGAAHRNLDIGTTLEIGQLIDTQTTPRSDRGTRTTDPVQRAIENQILVGQIVSYLDEMGIDPRLYALLASVPPTIGSRPITQDERMELGIENADDTVTDWRAELHGNGFLAIIDTQLTDRSLGLFCEQGGSYFLTVTINRAARDDLLLVLESGDNSIALDTDGGRLFIQFTGDIEDVGAHVSFRFRTDRRGAELIAATRYINGSAPSAVVGRNWEALVARTFHFSPINGDPRLPNRILQVCS